MNQFRNLLLAGIIVLSFVACGDDDNAAPSQRATFEVTIENILTPKSYLNSGTLGFLEPGQSETVTFNAGKGSYLSFATMFVQSNDLFYGFDQRGLRLYDDNGAVTGDVTGAVDLWDAGTEVNEEPGVGVNQAPRQSGPNTGADENGTVELIENVTDGYTYPTDENIIRLTLSHNGDTEFTFTIENISGSSTLPTPFAPGVWAVHGGDVQLFTEGAASPIGLEGLAEDGDNASIADVVSTETGYVSPFAPGVWAIHAGDVAGLFVEDAADRGEGLEALAEDGDPSVLGTFLSSAADITNSGVFNTPTGASEAGPLLPGGSYSFTFEAEEGDYLSFATMLVHTNDLFFGPSENGLSLFPNGTALSGDVTADIDLWDAGTEVNEYPGAGNSQPARGGGNSGTDENGNVRIEDDSFTYPAVNQTIRVTISAQ